MSLKEELADGGETQESQTEETSDDTEGQEEFTDTGEESEGEEATEEEESDLESEQSDEDQDEEEEEVELKEKVSGFKTKDGNFDWKRINKAVGNDELQKSFTESQRTITKQGQELKETKGQVAQLSQKAEMFSYFDQLYQSNPKVQAAFDQAINGQSQQQDFSPQTMQNQLPPGVDPQDPVVPILMQMAQTVNALSNQSRQAQERQVHEQRVNEFRQGLVGAKDQFVQLVGREPSEDELRAVAGKMRDMGIKDGGVLVPSLFIDEIKKNESRKFYASREQKKKLSKNMTGSRATSTSKPKSLRDAFDIAAAEHWED